MAPSRPQLMMQGSVLWRRCCVPVLQGLRCRLLCATGLIGWSALRALAAGCRSRWGSAGDRRVISLPALPRESVLSRCLSGKAKHVVFTIYKCHLPRARCSAYRRQVEQLQFQVWSNSLPPKRGLVFLNMSDFERSAPGSGNSESFIQRNRFGTPLLPSMYVAAQKLCPQGLTYTYINSDIFMVAEDFVACAEAAVRAVGADQGNLVRSSFLAVGIRHNVAPKSVNDLFGRGRPGGGIGFST